MLLRRIERTLERRRLLAAGDRGIVALSGGPDSLCLLHLLWRLGESWNLQLLAVHVDHGLRPESAAEAVRAVEKARAWGLEALSRRVRVETGSGRNLQEAARLARRAILEEEARKFGAAWVALGHTALDQAETVLMRLLRGAGPAGLSGMAWRRGLFVRPLLAVSRVEVERYLASHGLEPLRDPSNETPRFLRNRLRHNVLPLLEQENPALLSTLGRLAEICREENEALEFVAGQYLACALSRDADQSPVLAIDELGKLPRGLQHRILRLYYARAAGSPRRLERQHLIALAKLAASTDGTAYLDLPAFRAERRYAQLHLHPRLIEPTRGPLAEPAELAELHLAGPGRLDLGDGRVLELTPASSAATSPHKGDHALALLNAELLHFPLTVRGPRPGDRIRIGENRSRKVARLLLDAKIPRHERSRVPLLLAGREVMVVVGVRCAFGMEARPGVPQFVLRWTGFGLQDPGEEGVSSLPSPG